MTIRWLSQSEADLPATPVWLAPREQERAGGMRFAKRRNDYLLGRWTAKHAIARVLELPRVPAALAAIEIRNVAGGAPQAFVDGAPAPLSVSMSDRAGWGVCAVQRQGVTIGCDLELVEPRSEAFVADYLTGTEQAVVGTARGADERHRLANLIWSAKESALKVLKTGLRRDTRSVEVWHEETQPGAWARLRVRSEEGATFPGWWRQYGQFLLTIVATADLPPPVSLQEPPRLRDAVPTHAWLAAPLV
jgi:4'-phosphopantetheinyl transferase